MALVMAQVPFPSFQPQYNIAMGSKGNVVQPDDTEKDKKYIEKDREGGKSGEEISPKENGSQKKEKAPPQKKPRLKYREQPRCSC